MSVCTLFLILLTSAVNKHLDFLNGKEVARYLLNYKCPRLHRTNIERLLHIWTKESKNCNPLTACIILWVVEFFDYFCFFKVLYFFMTVNYINALYHAIDACDHETIIWTGVVCKKISKIFRISNFEYIENAKIFRSYVKYFWIFPHERNSRILIGLCK